MNILLIEDHKPDVVLLRELLTENTKQFFHLTHAERLEEGLALLKREHFDVALLDLSLPDAFGQDTFWRLHRQAPNLPIIILTGLDDEDLAIKLAQAGAQDYLVKSDLTSGILHRSIHYAIERKRVEEKLRLAATMFESTMEGILITDAKANIISVNQTLCTITGYHAEEIIGNTPNLLKSERHSPAFFRQLWNILNKTGQWRGEIWNRRKNGEVYPSWLIATAVKDAVGAVTHYVAMHIDITERKIMENELKASEAKFRSIIEACPVPMALHDEQLNITFLNQAFVQTFGYSIDDIPTLPDWRLKAYPDPDYRQWIETTWQMTQEKANLGLVDFPPLEVTIHCKHDSIKTALASAATIHHDFSGEHLVILYDITQRKQIEDKLNAIFNASVEGIITYDMSDIIVSANAAIEIIFGYKPEELIGCNICTLMPLSPSYALPQAVKFASQIREIEGIHKNGSVVPLDLSIAEFAIDNEHYFTYIVRDVSLRKHREQQDKERLDELAHVTRLGLMGEMASGIAHEVNQPLAAISSYAQVSLNLINTETPDLVKLAEVLYKTQQQALRAGRIVHRMREFIKTHAKHRSIADVNNLIHDAVGLCIPELKQNGIKLTFELENHLPAVCVDQIQIEQVIINLIRNSVDALQNLPEKQLRQLTIHSSLTPDNDILISVKDNGPGLDEDQQQKILTPFYTTKTNGMGMGLSISRSLVEAHEGTLCFNSQSEKGTCFYFTLPIREESDNRH
ncbi:PAS domain S-box protein [Methylobacter sp.]|uniref:PAS domain S-box protein n=1 Tax=Methylobacter sp. TaxID=2051955 RepID=UPI002FDCBA39